MEMVLGLGPLAVSLVSLQVETYA